jgi:putative transferase (TIGR04331 family)
MSLILVTCSDERTWPVDENILYLDNWCLKFERKDIWQKLNYEVYESRESIIDSKIALSTEIRDLENKIFGAIVKIMNSLHEKNHDENFWRILLGHWFRVYLATTLSRKRAIQGVINAYPITGASFIDLPEIDLIPKDFDSMCKLSDNPIYGSCLDFKIFKELCIQDFTCNIVNDHIENHHFKNKNYFNQILVKSRKLVVNLLWKFSHLFTNKTDPYIGSTYLPRLHEILLQLSFAQSPKNWRLFLGHKVKAKPDLDLRERLSFKLKQTADYGIITDLLFKLIPICYLEGFADLQNDVLNSKLPASPKFIFTSNDFASYELFKIYAAINSQKDCKYFIGQHGNNYGTNKLVSPTIEELTSTRFITWGQNFESENILSGFVFTNAGRKFKQKYRDKLLLVQHPLEWTKIDIGTHESSHYFKDQKKFIQLLGDGLVENIIIRLYGGTANSVHNELHQYNEIGPNLRLDVGRKKIAKLIDQSRLTIFSYDSTGMLENLALNIPTMAFWQFELEHLNQEAKEYYLLLQKVGIIHFSPESIASKVNEVWLDVEAWWSSSIIQEARITFCKRYANMSKKPVRDLRRIIQENL